MSLPLRWASALLVIALAGCASRAPVHVDEAPLVASGRLAVQVDALSPDQPARASSGLFELLGAPEAGELRLSSPLGTLLAVAQWRPGSVVLRAEGQTQEFASLEELTQAWLGESLPVAALFDWLRGRPWPGAPSEWLPVAGEGFRQLGWRVQEMRNGLIVAVRPGPPAVTVRARLDPA